MLKARWFQQYANVNFAFELVTVCKPNINRGGCKCLNLFAKNVDFFFLMVLFMDTVIGNLFLHTMEATPVIQYKASMES